MAQALNLPQKAIARLLRPCRLKYNRGDLAGIAFDKLLQAGNVVVTESNGELTRRLGNARVHQCRADEPVVHREERMIGAACDEIASGVCSGQSDSTARGIG